MNTAQYARYLQALSRISVLLLEQPSDQAWTEILHLLCETSRVSQTALFLVEGDAEGGPLLKLASSWSAGAASLIAPHAALRAMPLNDLGTLGERWQVGMAVAVDLADLPLAEAQGFRMAGAAHLVGIPLLVRGELAGVLTLLSAQTARTWPAEEIDILCTVANALALALVRRDAERASSANEARLRALVGATEDVVIEYDEHLTVHNLWSQNAGFLALLPRTVRGRSLTALPWELAQALQGAISPLLREASQHAEFSLHFPDGVRHFLGRFQLLPDLTKGPRHVVALLRDVTALRAEEARQRTMLDTLNLLDEAIIDLDADGNLVAATPPWARLCGCQRDQPAPCTGPLLQFLEPEDHALVQEAFDALIAGDKRQVMVRFRMLRPQAEQIWVECRLLGVADADGVIVGMRGILRDVTAAHLQERRIAQLALHDALTQLPNRILLEEHLHQAIARAQRQHGKVALGFIDLDHFKQINDTLGHHAGDTVLLTLSRRLSAVLRESDVLSRWGGDEFVVLLGDSGNPQDFRRIAERLREAARRSIDIDGIETKPTLSIGFAIYPDDATDADTLMSLADLTMFHAKSLGRNNVQFYGDIEGTMIRRDSMQLQTRLAQAIQAGTLQIFYQPVVDAGSGQVRVLEALARWHDDASGWISPEVFIPMAEHLGLIHELGDQVLAHALERLRAWRSAGHEVRVAINVSRAQLFAPQFVPRLMERVSDYGLRPQDLVLEITESVALLDVSYEAKRLQDLADAGFELAIDDFGTGYSGLAQLHDMPVHVLKVDGSFTARLDNANGQRIVQAIVQMAQALGLETVVEGVENSLDVQYLLSLGVRLMQGQFFGDPVPAGVCERLLARQAALPFAP